MSIKVMIVDDHIMVREGIKHLLELEGDIEVILEAGDGKECISILKQNVPDILLLDLDLPEMKGFDVLSFIKNKNLNIRVLLLAINDELDYLINALEFDVFGYILKGSGLDVLKNAIYSISSGNRFFDSLNKHVIKSKLIQKDIDKIKLELLSDREIQVLSLLAEGMLNKQIADILYISERTVKNHVSNIFKKIFVEDRTQAAIFAIRNNL